MSLLLHALKQIDGKPPAFEAPSRPAAAAEQPALVSRSVPPIAAPAPSASGSGASAPAGERKNEHAGAARAVAKRPIADVATDAQRQLATAVLANVPQPRRLLALVAVESPSDVCSLAGDLALGLAARQAGDVLLVGAASGESPSADAGRPERSLAAVVSGQIAWSDAVISSGIERLSLLERGTVAHGQLPSARRSVEAWQNLPGRFQHVVLDAGGVGDAVPSLLSPCDAILLVVRLGITSQARVDQAIERLRSIGLAPAGCLALASAQASVAA
jgi:Mrp family chromosome partitioning ATPase